MTLRVDEQGEPLKLVLKPGLLATTKVRVIYADGTPCADQYIGFTMTRATPQSSRSESSRTNEQGVRENHGIEPGYTCRYTVEAPGCPTVSTPEWVAVAGETHDFGNLVLHPEKGFVAGTVVDDAGRAIAGALVFNGTDGPRAASTRTDEQGHFRVEGLYAGEAFVFVRAAGYRVYGGEATVGTGDLKVVLAKRAPGALGEPLPLAPPALTGDAAKQLARQVLMDALTREGLTRTAERERLTRLLSRVDAEAAPTPAPIALPAPMTPEAFTAARDALLRRSPWDGGPELLDLCRVAPRERLPEWIEEVADLLEPPAPEQRGDGIQSLGYGETRRMVILALTARRLGYQNAREIMLRAVLSRMRNGWMRGDKGQVDLAPAVALLDPKLAQRLLPKEIQPTDIRSAAHIAALGATDPAPAAELLKQMPTGNVDRDRAFQQAAGDIAEALLLTPEERETKLLGSRDEWTWLPRAVEGAVTPF